MIPKRFDIKHKVLGILVDHYHEVYNNTHGQQIKIQKLNLPVKHIADKLSISEKRLRECCTNLIIDKEAEYEFDNETNQEMMRVDKNSVTAYVDKKYFLAGQKLLIDTFYDYFKIISGILLLGIALFTFIVNVITTRNNEKEIKNLQDQVNKLMQQKNKGK